MRMRLSLLIRAKCMRLVYTSKLTVTSRSGELQWTVIVEGRKIWVHILVVRISRIIVAKNILSADRAGMCPF